MQINITWNSLRDGSSATATVELHPTWEDSTNTILLDAAYKATNLQSELEEFGAKTWEIELWDSIEKVLPANRSHTSLSIGDTIQINRSEASIENQDGPTYRIAEIGFEMVGA